jgi:hypothetical protein
MSGGTQAAYGYGYQYLVTADFFLPRATLRLCASLSSTRSTTPRSKASKTAPSGSSPVSTTLASVLLAASPHVQGVTGRYFENCNEAVVVTEPGDLSGGVAPYALDQNDADRLWDETTPLLRR